MTADAITLDRVAASLTPHLPVYRWRKPAYQTQMLASLRAQWNPAHRRLLDIGGGTGVIANAVAELFGVEHVVSVDVEDRFLTGLAIETRVYDGQALPFEDAAFDAAMFNNVIHHVPPAVRAALLRECRRVAPGALYIKDHLAASPLDHARLAALDWIGNVPFSGMLKADYLTEADWRTLAAEAGYVIQDWRSDAYRSGPMAALFPNRLEISMRWGPPEG